MKNTYNEETWTGSWSVSANDFGRKPVKRHHQTVRVNATLSIGGSKLRFKFSNTYGDQPIQISEVYVALAEDGYTAIEGTGMRVTFEGNAHATLQPYQELLLSDDVDMKTRDLEKLNVSIFFAEEVSIQTGIFVGGAICSSSKRGNYTSSAHFPIEKNNPADGEVLPLLIGIDVLTEKPSVSLAAFGDSITASEWPDFLGERVAKNLLRLGVLRQGISGNKVVSDGPANYDFGHAGVKRFARDVLSQTGIKYVVVLHGVNDILHSTGENPLSSEVSAQEIIAGLRSYIKLAHENGVKIFGGTLMPFGDCYGATVKEEEKRQTVNAWIRNSGKFDGIVDFDAATQDPKQPTRLFPEYDGGDGLHPSTKGSRAMAKAVDLSLFKHLKKEIPNR